MKGLAEAFVTHEAEDDEQVLVGACTGTDAVAPDVKNITQTLRERKFVKEGMVLTICCRRRSIGKIFLFKKGRFDKM